MFGLNFIGNKDNKNNVVDVIWYNTFSWWMLHTEKV